MATRCSSALAAARLWGRSVPTAGSWRAAGRWTVLECSGGWQTARALSSSAEGAAPGVWKVVPRTSVAQEAGPPAEVAASPPPPASVQFSVGQTIENATVTHFGRAGAWLRGENGAILLMPYGHIIKRLPIGSQHQVFVVNASQNMPPEVALKPEGKKTVPECRAVLWATMKHQGGTLAFNESAAPQLIRQTLNMSKTQFTKAVGWLRAHHDITDTDEGGLRWLTYEERTEKRDRLRKINEDRKAMKAVRANELETERQAMLAHQYKLQLQDGKPALAPAKKPSMIEQVSEQPAAPKPAPKVSIIKRIPTGAGRKRSPVLKPKSPDTHAK